MSKSNKFVSFLKKLKSLFSGQEIDMTTGPLVKKMVIFSLPVALSTILQFLYNTADLAVVGQFNSKTSLSAVSVSGPISNLVLGVLIGLAIGTNVVVANAIGAKDESKMSVAVHSSMLLSVVLGVSGAAIGVIFCKPLLIIMNCEGELLRLANIYLIIVFCGIPFSCVYNFGAAIMRANGNTQKPLFYLFVSGMLNVVLNIVFVAALKMNVAGVALATSISQGLSAVLVVIDLMKLKGGLKFQFKKLRFDGIIVKQVLSIGVMSGLQSAMFNITNIIAQAYLIKIGPDVPASNAAQSNISGYLSTVSGAFYQAALAFTAQNVGAKNFPYIKKIQRCALIVSVSITIVFSAIVFILRVPLLKIFTDDEEVLSYAVSGLMIIVPGYFLWDIGEVSTGISKGLGSNAVPMILTAVFSCLFRILYFLFIFPYYGSYEIVIAVYPISWAFLAVFQYAWSKTVYKKAYKKYMLENASEPIA